MTENHYQVTTQSTVQTMPLKYYLTLVTIGERLGFFHYFYTSIMTA